MTTPYTLPEPFYRHGSGDIPSYGASQLKAAFASGAASKEFDIRGKLASSLKCWHRLSADEANELIAFAASRDAEIEALRADAAKWCEHVKPKIVGWMNPCNSLVTANLVHYHADKRAADVRASDLREPIKTQTTENRHALVTANLIHMGHGEGKDGGKRFSHGVRDVTEPLNTITASGATAAIVTSNLVKLRGTSVASATDAPLHTISAQGTHHAEVRAFLIKYYGTDQDPRLTEPMHTVPTKDRFGLVTVHGEEYAIVDIGLRMLTPRELYRAQGFPESYQIDHGGDGRPLTKTAQVRMCGNSVCPPMSRAIVTANYSEVAQGRKAA